LLKIVNNSHRDWHTRIPYALWEYCISIKNPTRLTPFSLVYGEKVIPPLEIEIPSLHISVQDYIIDEATHQTRLDQLFLHLYLNQGSKKNEAKY